MRVRQTKVAMSRCGSLLQPVKRSELRIIFYKKLNVKSVSSILIINTTSTGEPNEQPQLC